MTALSHVDPYVANSRSIMGLLGGVESRVTAGVEGNERKGEEGGGIEKEELRDVAMKLKEIKTMGEDEMPNEAWKNGRGGGGGRMIEMACGKFVEVCEREKDGHRGGRKG